MYVYVNNIVIKSNKVEVVERLIDLLRGWTIEAHSSSVSSRVKAVALESLEIHHLGDVHHRWPTQYHETYEERVLCEIMCEATYRRLLSRRSYPHGNWNCIYKSLKRFGIHENPITMV